MNARSAAVMLAGATATVSSAPAHQMPVAMSTGATGRSPRRANITSAAPAPARTNTDANEKNGITAPATPSTTAAAVVRRRKPPSANTTTNSVAANSQADGFTCEEKYQDGSASANTVRSTS